MEAFNFTAANEDANLYTFDMRKLDIALNVHKDHVAAVYVLSSFAFAMWRCIDGLAFCVFVVCLWIMLRRAKSL